MCCNSTFREEVSDVQLQGGNDLVKHLELLPKARHLEDEAGWHLRLKDNEIRRLYTTQTEYTKMKSFQEMRRSAKRTVQQRHLLENQPK